MTENGKDTKLAIRQPSSLMPMGQELQDAMLYCEINVNSGCLPPHINTKEKAFAIAMYGRSLGLDPWMAWRMVYPVAAGEGKVGMNLGISADGMLSLAVGRIRGFKFGIEVKRDDKGQLEAVSFWSERPGIPRLVTTKTLKAAALAGLTTKGTWMKYPEAMLTADAQRANLRKMAADVLAGIYTPEELGGDDPTPKEAPKETMEYVDADVITMADPMITNTEETN